MLNGKRKFSKSWERFILVEKVFKNAKTLCNYEWVWECRLIVEKVCSKFRKYEEVFLMLRKCAKSG